MSDSTQPQPQTAPATAPAAAPVVVPENSDQLDAFIAERRQTVARLAAQREVEEHEYTDVKAKYDKMAARLAALRESLMRTSQERTTLIKELDVLLQAKASRDNVRKREEHDRLIRGAPPPAPGRVPIVQVGPPGAPSTQAPPPPAHQAPPPVAAQAAPPPKQAPPPVPAATGSIARSMEETRRLDVQVLLPSILPEARTFQPAAQTPPPQPPKQPAPQLPPEKAAAPVEKLAAAAVQEKPAAPADSAAALETAPGMDRPPAFGNRRQQPRVPLAIEVDLRSDTNLYVGFSENISEGGLFVATYEPRPVGDRMAVQFTLPGQARVFQLETEVAWSVPFRDEVAGEAPRVPGMGLRFLNLTDNDRTQLMRFISQREPLFFPQ